MTDNRAYKMIFFDLDGTLLPIETDAFMRRYMESLYDYCVDMGPGGGEEGGRVVVCGTPEQLMDEESSLTGRCLKEYCAGRNNRD